MNSLYAELTSSHTEYLESGEMRSHPPNSLQLRAARAIKQLFEEGQGLSRAHMQLQQEFAHLYDELTKLKAKYEPTTGTESDNATTDASVCNGEQQTSPMGG